MNDNKNNEGNGEGFAALKAALLHLCVNPADAYKKRYSELVFAGLMFPCISFLFFALNIGLERMSFLSSANEIRTMLLAFIGLIVGAGTAAVMAVIGYFAGRVSGQSVDGTRFFGCVEYSFAISAVIETVGLVLRLAGVASSASFGVLGIFAALAFVFKSLASATGLKGIMFACFAALCAVAAIVGMSILLFASF